MNEPERRPGGAGEDQEDDRRKGPNLVLIYGLLALAMAAAIGFALMIVMPFYHRH
jgi:hypothetical protein